MEEKWTSGNRGITAVLFSSLNNIISYQVPYSATGKMRGLCGNFNNDLSDDKLNKFGQLVRTTKEFGDSWSIRGPPCEESSCPKSVQNKAYKLCNTIKFPPFNKCKNVVEKGGFLSKCIETTCDCLSQSDQDERGCR